MLRRILHILRSSDGTLTLREVASRLDAPVSAIEPMVDLLVRVGLLGTAGHQAAAGCASSCGDSCDPAACPFTVTLPVPLEVRSLAHEG
jgi:predicted transcriptional regulator